MANLNKNTNFSIVVTCVNESKSLLKTIDILIKDNINDLKEIVIVYPDRVTESTLKIINKICSENQIIIPLKQSRPHVGGAVRDAFEFVSGKYVIMMASDLETDPVDVKQMIKEFKRDPELDLVTASRWALGEKNFNGYGIFRVILNYCFNKLFSILYNTSLTDMTFGYRGFRTSIVKSLKWDNYKHSFFFETIIKPLQLDCKIIEIPTKWVAREDESPQISRDYVNFIFIGLKFLFRKGEKNNNDRIQRSME